MAGSVQAGPPTCQMSRPLSNSYFKYCSRKAYNYPHTLLREESLLYHANLASAHSLPFSRATRCAYFPSTHRLTHCPLYTHYAFLNHKIDPSRPRLCRQVISTSHIGDVLSFARLVPYQYHPILIDNFLVAATAPHALFLPPLPTTPTPSPPPSHFMSSITIIKRQPILLSKHSNARSPPQTSRPYRAIMAQHRASLRLIRPKRGLPSMTLTLLSVLP